MLYDFHSTPKASLTRQQALSTYPTPRTRYDSFASCHPAFTKTQSRSVSGGH
jgi:hypothetical protein